MSRDVLVVGGGSPGAALAAELAGSVRLVAPEPTEVDDGFVDRLAAAGTVPADGLDMVVHALYPAPSRRPARIDEQSPDEWRAACDTPLEAGIRLARGAHRYLRMRRGVIVFCGPLVGASGAANHAALAGLAEGLRVLARSLARGWGVDGIRAHAVTLHPSMFLAPDDATGAAEATALHDPALGRLPLVSEIASVIDRLAGPGTRGLTGASLVMDGGAWMAG